MNFLESIKTCFRKYITFSGRASRSEYWYFVLAYTIGSIITKLLDLAIFHVDYTNNQAVHPINTFFYLAMVLPVISVAVRRMHDVNRNGWWLWIELTIIGAIFPILVWKCTKGTEGPNQYGPDPLAVGKSSI